MDTWAVPRESSAQEKKKDNPFSLRLDICRQWPFYREQEDRRSDESTFEHIITDKIQFRCVTRFKKIPIALKAASIKICRTKIRILMNNLKSSFF